jgi:low temperature requirement protein LtrA
VGGSGGCIGSDEGLAGLTRHHLFRTRNAHDHNPVTYIELFFDLVFVFAITQLSHRLLAHLTFQGALETLVLLLAVWWVWICTSWTTNWLDPDHAHVRLMLILLMGGGLVLSSAIPEAFGKTGFLFAISYIAMQIFRSLYMVWASRGVDQGRVNNFIRVTFWFSLSAPLWITGALLPPEQRLLFWLAALSVEYAGPFVFFRTPLLGQSNSTDWNISGAHMAERCALFVIIVLGEAVLVTGATFANLQHNQPTWIAFITSFASSAIMWWIYFDIGAKRASDRISGADNAGLLARNAYTYLHLPIIAGVIVTAVGDEKMLAHPLGHASPAYLAMALGGPLIFLLGNQLFKWATSELPIPPLSHFIGLALLGLIAFCALHFHWQPVTVGIASLGALLATAFWEWASMHGGWRHWAPWSAPLFERGTRDEQ